VPANKHLLFWGFITISVSLLSGCAQLLGSKAELPQRRLYMVDVEPMRNDIENSARPYAFQVQIKSFEAPRAYNRKEIIIRRDQYELQHDNFHHWTERPADLFTDVVKQYLRQANLFTYIGGDRDFYERRPQYVLNGRIKAIERFDSGDVWAAHLAMTIELVRQEDGKIIWQTDFDEERNVFFPEMKHTVSAFSVILGEQMKKIIRSIDFVFLNQQRSGQKEALEELTSSTNELTATSKPDTTLFIETNSNDYEIIPGKLTP